MALDMGKTMKKGHRKKHGETIIANKTCLNAFQEGT